MQTFKSIRGFNDLMPTQVLQYQLVEERIKKILNNSGFNEIRTPIVEYEDLFKRSVGTESDIVSKEMYTINRTDEKSFTLRPEGTVGVARAIIENNLISSQQKLWYNGYMFRAENPQKGRYRQFQQFGVEVYGISDINIDVEVLNLSFKIFKELNLLKNVKLEINNIGSFEDRKVYAENILSFMKKYYGKLPEDVIKKLEKNPLRILDSKDDKIIEMLKDVPLIDNFINEESKSKFEELKYMLKSLGIEYTVNQKLVRGLDYYNDIVFEWTSNLSESQGTVCAGGRYDTLTTQLGSKEVPAIGFAIGIERLILLMDESGLIENQNRSGIAISVLDKTNFIYALKIQDEILKELNEKVYVINEQTSLKSQMKKADKLNVRYVLIFGSNEISENKVTVKDLEYGTQETLNIDCFLSKIK